ncbi:hypothetical protein SARC_12337 [Sphaeroforma arctica JP610]|uniref:Uncharacterized protein n=1 Tax=Sphaeroforma arctica JP610 TaxID=667725 RepID=A0A0L0FF99_9EUKA|nr:hypothetical protein SARC_12337 [Sphaeroforma arctica JP610]KNC75131.1 hypothetical protein SARC_12337 [Sphaeroforma arctica JP610]|eukprot:XP_014149033.1 hypothetical protein SARC_12337 [Sphaeroforma arctica JP610]
MDRLVDPTQRQTKLTRADIDLLYTLAAEGCGEIIAETENSSTTQITYIVHRLFTVVSVCVQQLMAADTQPKVGHGSEGGASGLAVFNRAAPESEKGPGRSVVGT